MSDEKIGKKIKSLENIDVAIRGIMNDANIRRRNNERKWSEHKHLVRQLRFLRLMGIAPYSHLRMETWV